jgi:hypothetical protein
MKVKTAIRRSSVQTQSRSSVDSQVYTAGTTAIGVSACAIGLWAVACLIGGMLSSGGPIALVGDWVGAVFGI